LFELFKSILYIKNVGRSEIKLEYSRIYLTQGHPTPAFSMSGKSFQENLKSSAVQPWERVLDQA